MKEPGTYTDHKPRVSVSHATTFMWCPRRAASSHNVTLSCLFLSSSSSAAPWRRLDTRQARCHAPRDFRSLSWSHARVYFSFYIISSTFECVAAAETGSRLFSIQQRVPNQPLLYLAWDTKTEYVMIQTSCPCTLMDESLQCTGKHNLSKFQNNNILINSLIQLISNPSLTGTQGCIMSQNNTRFKISF